MTRVEFKIVLPSATACRQGTKHAEPQVAMAINLVRERQIFWGPRYGTCFMFPFRPLEFNVVPRFWKILFSPGVSHSRTVPYSWVSVKQYDRGNRPTTVLLELEYNVLCGNRL